MLNISNMNESVDKFVDNIIGFSVSKDGLLQKFELQFFLKYFDQSVIIRMASTVPQEQEISLQEFIRIFLLQIKHEQYETLYLSLGLRKMYDAICQRSYREGSIKFGDFTNFLCQKISRDDLEIVIPSKQVPLQKMKPQRDRIRDIDLFPTIITSKVDRQIPKLSKDMRKKNKKMQEKRGVGFFCYAPKQNKIIGLGCLASSIGLYDLQLHDRIQIRPHQCLEMQKDIAILSMAYNKKQDRIGAIINNMTMIFWEGCDNYTTQKAISTKGFGDKIFYLQIGDQWITADSKTIYFWDIRDEKVVKSIVRDDATAIMNICQINHLRCICVAYACGEIKLMVLYHKGKKVGSIILEGGCHTLHYNRFTQSLISIGYQNVVPVYQIESNTFDIELKSQLRGHRSIVTCVDSMEESSLLLTGDDLGEIRIWQLNYMRCIQGVKIAKWLSGVRWIGNRILFADSRLNILNLKKFHISKGQNLSCLYQFYEQGDDYLWVITKCDARKISLSTGRVLHIFILCKQGEEITAAVHLKSGFIVGNSRGELQNYDEDGKLRWSKNAHDGEILNLRFDLTNRFIISLGTDGLILFWPERSAFNENQRKKIQYKHHQPSQIQICSKNNLLITCSTVDQELCVWDYQILKLQYILKLQSEVTCFCVYEGLLIIGFCLEIHLIKISKQENNMQMEIIHVINTKQLGQNIFGISSLKVIKQQGKNLFLMGGTNQGSIFCYNITNLVSLHFPLLPSFAKKQSVNMQRNHKQVYLNCISQAIKCNITALKVQKQNSATLVWSKQIHKESIKGISKIQLKSCMIVTLCSEYLKILDFSSSKTVSSLNINHPLPVKWDLIPSHHAFLKKKIYQILQIIDSILRNKGYQMLARQYKLINISNFMQRINNEMFDHKEAYEKPQILNSQYTHEDILGISQEEPTLKSLEAYKRVKLIKKINEQQLNSSQIVKPIHEMQIDKDHIMQLLDPKYFDKFNKIGQTQRQHTFPVLGQRLNQSLIIGQKRNKKENDLKRANLVRASTKKSLLAQDNNVLLSKKLKKRIQSKSQWQGLQNQPVQTILRELNSKLRGYKMQRRKNLQL